MMAFLKLCTDVMFLISLGSHYYRTKKYKVLHREKIYNFYDNFAPTMIFIFDVRE